LMKRCFVVAAVGVNCYVLEGMYGDREIIDFGCVFADWERACEALLAKNIHKAMMDPEEEQEE
jgi:hypothetical protein